MDLGGPQGVRHSDLSPALRDYLLATLDWAERGKGWDRVKHCGLEFAKPIPAGKRKGISLDSGR